MIFDKSPRNIKWPEYSFLGFKILNSWNSILCAYILIFAEFILVPFFGIEFIQYIAGLLFILINNIAIIILIINSLIRKSKFDNYFIITSLPLIIYGPFLLNKIYDVISNLNLLFR